MRRECQLDHNTNSLQYSKNYCVNPFRANPAKWSDYLKQFIDNLPTNCYSVFDHFVALSFKRLKRVFNPFM